MAAIKKFFQKRKLDVKFKKAGEGHKLSSERSPPPIALSRGASGSQQSYQRAGPNEETRHAAAAAMARMSTEKKVDHTMMAKARMRKELAAEKKQYDEAMAAAQRYQGSQEVIQDAAPVLSAVLFKCPEISPAVLPKAEMETHIHEFLLSQLAEEPEMTSALMIHTLNKDTEKVKVCINTLCKYMDNIIGNPEEEKFRKIRMTNKAFKERIACLQGTEEFMQAAGFQMKMLPFEDHEEHFYVMDEEVARDIERLTNLKEVLVTAEPIKPQLDRDLKVFHPSKSASQFTIPNEFYTISPDELRKEQQRRQEAVEQLGMLRTKAMRERDEQRELRKYRYALIRIRFPDEVILQGTFKAHEKILSLTEFVKENLVNDWMPFQLVTQTGHILSEPNSTIAEQSLTPSAVVNMEWDKTLIADIAAQQGSSKTSALKPEVMALIQNL